MGRAEQLRAHRSPGPANPAGTFTPGQPSTFHGQAYGQAAIIALVRGQPTEPVQGADPGRGHGRHRRE